MKTKSLSTRLTITGLLLILLFSAADTNAEEPLTFHPAKFYAMDEVSQAYHFSVLDNDYNFEVFPIDFRIEKLSGFCVSDDQLFLVDNGLNRINILDREFQRIDTIRGGSEDDPRFSPSAIHAGDDGNVIVMGYALMGENTASVAVYTFGPDGEMKEYTGFTLQVSGAYPFLSDFVRLEDGSAYMSVGSDAPGNSRIFYVSLGGEVLSEMTAEVSGKLSSTPARDGAVLVSGFYGIQASSLLRGVPALYVFEDGEMSRRLTLPSVIKVPLSAEEKQALNDVVKSNDYKLDEGYEAVYSLDASFGYRDIAQRDGQYYVLIPDQPAIYVFSTQLEYEKTIPVRVGNSWDSAAYAAAYFQKTGELMDARYLDIAEDGTIYILAYAEPFYGERQLIGIIGRKIHE